MIYDKEYFKKYIDSLVQSYDYYNNKIKYVIIDDFDCINITTQRYLKVILEKTFKTTRFILITNKLNSIDIATGYRKREAVPADDRRAVHERLVGSDRLMLRSVTGHAVADEQLVAHSGVEIRRNLYT